MRTALASIMGLGAAIAAMLVAGAFFVRPIRRMEPSGPEPGGEAAGVHRGPAIEPVRMP